MAKDKGSDTRKCGGLILSSIPVMDLLQMSHPGYRLLKQKDPIGDKQLPVFLDFCTCACERFAHYADEIHGAALPPNQIVIDIIDCFKTLIENDEPGVVFPARASLAHLLEEFEGLCESMADCFSHPPMVKSFYTELSKTLTLAGEDIVGANAR